MNEDERLAHYHARKAKNSRDWYERHRDEIKQKRQLARLERFPPLPKSGYQIIALSDPRDATNKARFIAIRHTDRDNAGWLFVWENCERIDSNLAAWFRDLRVARVEPVERVILGSVPLNLPLAIAALGALCARLKPDLNYRPTPGIARPIVVQDASREFVEYPSLAAAGRGLGIKSDYVAKRLYLGQGVLDGRLTPL